MQGVREMPDRLNHSLDSRIHFQLYTYRLGATYFSCKDILFCQSSLYILFSQMKLLVNVAARMRP
jgi:hypothetical protein